MRNVSGMEGSRRAAAKLSDIGSQANEEWEDWMKWDDLSDAKTIFGPFDQDSIIAKQSSSNSKKRKSLPDDGHDSDSGKPRPAPVSRSHNIVERRYRTNINDKIAALKDSIPSLRGPKESESQSTSNPGPPKLNKATVLSTAVDYIQSLEKDKHRLENEISELKAQLRAAQEPGHHVEEPNKSLPVDSNTGSPEGSQNSTCTSTGSSTWSNAQGMIEVPEDMRRLRSATMQNHQAEASYLEYRSVSTDHMALSIGENATKQAKLMGKLVIGSFAGLMIMQGFSHSGNEVEGGSVKKRGLLASHTPSLWPNRQGLQAPHGLDGNPARMRVLLAAFKVIIVMFVLGFSIFLYAFCFRPKPRNYAQRLDSTPSLTSPLEVRRNAWLTAIQTVRVPRHEMFPEWAAVNLEALQYVLRHVIGWHNYSRLTGHSEDDEIARVRAWDIAIDAQLMGGDAEISGSRLVLTILASGTLPRTPSRLIVKATHLRILLWKALRPGRSSTWSIVHKISAALADQQWRYAQDLQRNNVLQENPNDSESLPEHLAALLQLNCHEVLTDPITQRAHNLAWSRPIREDIYDKDMEMDLVVEDSTIRSPHDAISAWVSSTTLRKCLFTKLSDLKDDSSDLDWHFGIALQTAPPVSIAQAKALAANAVFVETNRQSALSSLLQDFMPNKVDNDCSTSSQLANSTFVDSSLPRAVCYDVSLAIYCVLALEALNKAQEDPKELTQALYTVSLGYQDAKELTWLSFTAAYYLLNTIESVVWLRTVDKRELYRIIPRLLLWFKEMEESEAAIGRENKMSISFALGKHLAIRDESDIAALAGTKPDSRAENSASSQASSPLQGEAAGATSETWTVSKPPPLVPKGREIRSSRTKNRRTSHCSDDSGYGSAETQNQLP